MQELKPMHWPRPVPLLFWTGDYADIRERVRRDGRLDTDDLWEPHSGDSYEAFCGRHGTWAFDLDWREINQREREAKQRAYGRNAERARQQQEAWEAERRRRQQAKQARADREWQEAEAARKPPPPKYTPPPLRMPTADELSNMALQALNVLLAMRSPASFGHAWLGTMCSRVAFPREGGSLPIAIEHLVREIPAAAGLSAHPLEVPPGTLGANATTPYASLRVTLSPSNTSLYFDVTWDSA